MAEGSDNSLEVYNRQREFLKLTEKGAKSPRHLLQSTKENMSLAHGGKSVVVRDELKKGAGLKEIQETKGLTTGQMNDARKTLKGWGEELPLTQISWKKTIEKINNKEDNKELQGILDGLSTESITAFLRRNKNQKTFIGLGNLLEELGFASKNAHLVGERLRTLQDPLPVGEYKKFAHKGEGQELKGTYWIILTKRKEDVVNEINAMSARGELKKLPTQAV